MATPQPTAPFAQPPPTLPNMPDVSDTLSRYLRTFSLWCVQGLASKLNTNSAIPGLQLQATDQPVPNNPVYELGVTSAGAATLAPVTLGTGTVGTPVPVGTGQYLPIDGYGYVHGVIPIRSTDNAYAYIAFYDATPTRKGWMGWSSGNGGLLISNDASGCYLRIGDDGVNYSPIGRWQLHGASRRRRQ